MTEVPKITFAPVTPADLPQFIKDLQGAFVLAVEEKFGRSEPIPASEEVEESFHAPNTETYHLLLHGQRVGGVVLTIHPHRRRGSLDLFFIDPARHSQGLGLAAWQAIEARYPEVTLWETATPYFEERNIHFYVNKCGFHIVEFFHDRHRDPNLPLPRDQAGETDPGTEAFFRFEKVLPS